MVESYFKKTMSDSSLLSTVFDRKNVIRIYVVCKKMHINKPGTETEVCMCTYNIRYQMVILKFKGS